MLLPCFQETCHLFDDMKQIQSMLDLFNWTQHLG